MNRRAFLTGTFNSTLNVALNSNLLRINALNSFALMACTSGLKNEWLVSTAIDSSISGPVNAANNKQYCAVALDSTGNIKSKVYLPARGHDVLACSHKPGHALVFARRPDRFAMEIDFVNGKITHQFNTQTDTHFYGHGSLSKDGRYLYTTENLYNKGIGLVVVRDTQNYQVIERYTSGGIGPHQLAFLPNSNILVIANGGINTHPDYPRIKLNLDDMSPNLSYMDTSNGKIIDTFTPPIRSKAFVI